MNIYYYGIVYDLLLITLNPYLLKTKYEYAFTYIW